MRFLYWLSCYPYHVLNILGSLVSLLTFHLYYYDYSMPYLFWRERVFRGRMK